MFRVSNPNSCLFFFGVKVVLCGRTLKEDLFFSFFEKKSQQQQK
tara:strand:+ start:706 stop:837 length:132 start_codon:yes stop_codon:yes gene_type:complete